VTSTRSRGPAKLRIGVTGHRVLAEVERVQAGVEAAIAVIETSFPGMPLVVVSALAEGADRLVAKALLARPDSRLRAVLPLPRLEYLDDFASPESKAEFVALLARADEVVELQARTVRDEAYAAANDRLLGEIDVLIAVWDGLAAQGGGGTAEVVARARARGLPLAWVHAGNRKPGTTEPTTLGADQGSVTNERLSMAAPIR
jgi:hypothetical protein